MTTKAFVHVLRNKLLFNWLPFIRPVVNALFTLNGNPVFVLGNQKAGTSAIAALLGEATGLSYDIDLAGFRVPQYEAVYEDPTRLDSLIRSRARVEFSKGLVKEPNLTFLYPALSNLYPDAKFVFVVRDPRDNIRSILNRLRMPGNLNRIDYDDYPELSPMWKAILLNRWVGDPTRELNYVGRAAERWQTATEMLPPGGAATPIRYEDFRANKAERIYRLAAELGLSVRNDITARVDVQYQPAGRPVVNYGAFFGAANLRTILDICRPGMEAYGYLSDSLEN